MPEGWVSVPLGSVTTQVGETVPVRAGETYRLLGVSSKGRGVFGKEPISADATKAKHFTPVKAGQFIYNRLFAGTGSFGVVPDDLDNTFVSNEFPVFDTDPDLLDVRYLGLLFQRPEIWEQVASECVGSTGSRMRWKEDRFRAFVMDLPPLVEQQYVVEIISAADAMVFESARVVTTTRETAASIRRELFRPTSEGSPIRDLLARNIGGVWGGEPGSDEIDVVVYRSTDFTNHGELRSEVGAPRSITKKQLASRELRRGDILLEKSGGGPNQPVGRVVRVEETRGASVCANFVQLLTPDPSTVNPGFLFYALLAWHEMGRTEEYQRRTTGLRNLRTKDYLALPVDVSELDSQSEAVALLDAFSEAASTASAVRDGAIALRAALLEEFLTGKHEVPGSHGSASGFVS